MVSLESLIISKRYLLIKKIGEGSFGEVYLAIDTKRDDFLAIKVESTSTLNPQLINEAKIL